MIGAPHEFVRQLVDRFGVPQSELVALAPGNDPFLAGRPADVAKARWFAALYEELGRPRVHLRDLHYMAVARMFERHDGGLYAGTAEDWALFCTASSKARELGLVSPFAFVDQRTRAVHEYDADGEGSEAALVVPNVWLGAADLTVPEWEAEPPRVEAPDQASLRPVVAELWVEKASEALEREILPIARSYRARVVVGVGFQSETAAADLICRAVDDGRPRVVLWLADADASGESMATATARHVEFLTRHWLPTHQPETEPARILIDRVALTLDQLATIEADTGQKIPVSPDVRREEGRVELQALAAFAPGWVAGELERRLDELHDRELGLRLFEWQSAAQEQIETTWEDETAEVAIALDVLTAKRDEILDRYDVPALLAELASLDHEREQLEAGLQQAADVFLYELPEPPHGAVDLDSRDWLLDSDRDYLDQLNAYRRHAPSHRKQPPLMLVERVCANPDCGAPLAGKKAGALYCDASCRQAARRHRP